MPIWPIKPRKAQTEAEGLLAAVIAAGRRPALFGEGRCADTLEGRFELMALHGALALIRLKAAPEAAALAQEFTDRLFRHFDAGLREAAVSDLAVPKRMRALAGAFYGRLEAYAAPLAASDEAGLAAALARNIPGVSAAYAATLASYVRALARRQASAPVAVLSAPWEASPL